MGFDLRWLIAIIGLITIAIFFAFSRKKENFLLRLLVFTMPFGLGFFFIVVSGQDDAVYATDVLLFFLYLYWFWETDGFTTQKIYHDTILYLYIALIIWALTPIVMVISQLSLLFAVFTWIKCLFIFLYISNRVKSKEQLWIIIEILMIALFIQGFIGTLQKFLGHTLGLEFLGERRAYLKRFGEAKARARGTLGFPNQYAAYMIMLMPMAVTMFIYSKKGIKKIWYAAVIGVSSMGWVFSASRSAWLGLVGALLFIFIFLNKTTQVSFKSFFLLLLVILIIALFIFVFEDIVMQRIQTAGHQEHRRVMIAMALKFIAQNPVFGVGLWNYQFHSFGDFRYWHAVHNMFLRLGSELGIPGLLLFLIILFNSFKNCLIGLKFQDKFLNHLALAIMGGQLAFIIAAMFNPQYQHYRHKFLFWFLIGLGVAIKRMGLKEAFIAFQNRKKRMLKEREEEDIGLIDIE